MVDGDGDRALLRHHRGEAEAVIIRRLEIVIMTIDAPAGQAEIARYRPGRVKPVGPENLDGEVERPLVRQVQARGNLQDAMLHQPVFSSHGFVGTPPAALSGAQARIAFALANSSISVVE